MGHGARLTAAVFVALVFAAIGIAAFAGWTQRSAEAQTATESILTAEDLRILEKIADDTRVAEAARARGEIPAASMEEAQSKSRRVMTRSMRTAYLRPVPPAGGGVATGTSITPALMRAGLAGLAAGIWTHNGVMIYNGIQCGQADCPDAIELDAQFLRSAQMGGMAGYWGEYGYYVGRTPESAKGKITGAVFITDVEYSPTTKSATYTYETTGRVPGASLSTPTYEGGGGCQAPRFLQSASNAEFSGSPQRMNPSINRATDAVKLNWRGGELGCTHPNDYRTIQNPVFDVRQVEYISLPEYIPGQDDYVPSVEQNRKLIDGIKSDPEYDLDEDGLINRDDPDDDGDGVPDVEDPEPYDPYSPKPWLHPDFRAPSDSAGREALWGPVIGTWTTPGGGECKEFQSGAKICDFPGGTTFVWIVEDRAMWMQSSNGGGSKDWIVRPPNLSSGPGVSYGGPENQKPEEEFDDIGYLESNGIAGHVVDENHRIPGVEPPDDVEKVRQYIEATVDKVETSGKRYYYETDELDREVLSGPYYSLYTHGEYAGQYKKAYWDAKNGVIIVRDPAAQYGGTAFIPTDPNRPGRKYLEDEFPNAWHDRRRLEQ